MKPGAFKLWLRSLNEDVYSLSSTQVNLPDPLDDFVIKWGRMNIPDENLYFDEDGGLGRETEPHVTVLYGLKEQEPSKELLEIVRRTKPFTIRLGKVSLFEAEEYDVVKFEVISDDLCELSNAIRVACPNENKFPKYVPHCTVAYCKKGTVADLAGQYPFEASPPIPNEFEASEIVFSGAGDSENPKRVRKYLAFNRLRKESLAEAIVPGAALAFFKRQPWVVYTYNAGNYSYFCRVLAPLSWSETPMETYTWVSDPGAAEKFMSKAQAEQAVRPFYSHHDLGLFGIKTSLFPVQEAKTGAARAFFKGIDPWSYQVEEDHDYLKPPAFAGPRGYHALLCWHGKPQGATRTYEDRSKAEAEAKAYISKFKKLNKVLPYAAHIESYAHLWDWFRAAVNAEPLKEAKEGSARDFLSKVEIPKYVICALHRQDSTAAPLYAIMGPNNAWWAGWTEDLGSATRFVSKEEAQVVLDAKFNSFDQSFNRMGVVTYAYARAYFKHPRRLGEAREFLKNLRRQELADDVSVAVSKSIGQDLPFRLVPVGAYFKHEGEIFQRIDDGNWGWNWLKGGNVPIGDNEVVTPVDNQYSPFDKVGFPEDSSVLTRKLGKR